MRKLKRIGIILLSIICIVAAFMLYVPKTKAVDDKNKGNIRIMSYNLRYSSSDYEMWKKRKGILAEQILKYKPDSLGIQEGDWGWMNSGEGLPELLEEYAYVGIGRDDGEKLGEYSAIFYLRDKYEEIDSGTFWISETPDTPSRGWDAVCNRICTWVTLKNKETGEIFTHFNTHLDHIGKEARTKGAELLLNRIKECKTPVVLTGDMNFFEGSKYYKIFEESEVIKDSKHSTENTMSYGTMNWFYNFNFRVLKPIDFCFVSESSIEVSQYRVDNSYKMDGKPVSDHYPVIVDIKLVKK